MPHPPTVNSTDTSRRWFFRRRREDALDALARSHCGVVVCDEAGRITSATDAAARWLGFAPAVLQGHLLSDWLLPGGEPLPVQPGAHWRAMRGPKGRSWSALVVRVAAQDADANGCVYLLQPGMPPAPAVVPELMPDIAQPARHTDTLTGLKDRTAFQTDLSAAMDATCATGFSMALLFVNLDEFKRVNDSWGHAAGDALLCHVAQMLCRAVDLEPGQVSRIGGDEFAVIVPGVSDAEDAAMVAKRVLDALEPSLLLGRATLQVSASIGIALYAGEHREPDRLLRQTSMALCHAKKRFRGNFSFFSPEMAAASAVRHELENSLRGALERQEFVLYYQPKVSLETGCVLGVEALLRWRCPGRGLVLPDRFMAALEDTRLILPVGAWVLRTACADLVSWDQQGLPRLSMAVNLSPIQLTQPFLARAVADTLSEHSLDPKRLALELTESQLLQDGSGAAETLDAFARMGVRVVIDDFGTGHSSLSLLKQLHVDTLKLDRSFIAELPHDREDLAIASAIIAMGRSLQMRVVAEGVETPAQSRCLANLGCHEAQGWLMGRPMPAAELAAWLLAREGHGRDVHVGDTEPMALMSLETSDTAEFAA